MPSKLKLIHTEKLNNEKEQRKFYLDKLNRSLSRNTKVNRYSFLGKFCKNHFSVCTANPTGIRGSMHGSLTFLQSSYSLKREKIEE